MLGERWFDSLIVEDQQSYNYKLSYQPITFNFHCLWAQVSGMKIVICAAVVELMEHFGVNGLAEARDRFSALSASDLPDPASGQGWYLFLWKDRFLFIINRLYQCTKTTNDKTRYPDIW